MPEMAIKAVGCIRKKVIGEIHCFFRSIRRYLLCYLYLSGVGGITLALFCILPQVVTGGKDKNMKTMVPKNEFGLFADIKGVPRIDSMTVAEIFGKRHDNVIRDIRGLDCSKEFLLLNFEEQTYIDNNAHTLQRVDIGLLISTPDFQKRKQYLEWFYMKKFQ